MTVTIKNRKPQIHPYYMSARNGKIARLPRPVRDELNRRLECSEESPELLDWLNALPEVQAVLNEHFEGAPVTKQNLSHWRQGGFQEALARRDLAQDAHDLTDPAREMGADCIDADLADNAALVLAARLGALVANWDGEASEQFAAKAKIFSIIGRTLTQLQRQVHESRRENAALKTQAEQQKKALAKEARSKAWRREMDKQAAPELARHLGGGPEALKQGVHTLAILRGDLDQDSSSIPHTGGKSQSVQVGQGAAENRKPDKAPTGVAL
jgi:hypothetical protein